MSKLFKITIAVISSFMFFTLSFGYAAISDALNIGGDATIEAKPFEGVYIYAVERYASSNVANRDYSFTHPTNLKATVNANANGSITYKITFHNNSTVKYWYVKQNYNESINNNSLLTTANGITILTKDHPADNTSTFNSEDWIPPNTYRDVYVTYKFGNNATGNITTFINFMFGIRMDAVHDDFLAVLNSSEVGGGYDMISKAFDEKYAKDGSVILANVGDEKAIFDELFGGDITINIDGNPVPVTLVVRRENVDKRSTGDDYSSSNAPKDCEYTLYITVDPLDSPTGKAIVYAVSYSKGGTSNANEWYQIGELYEGTANIISYDNGENAIDYKTWVASPKEYVVANGITYLVGQTQQGDQYDRLSTVEQLMSTDDRDIFNAINNTGILKTVYHIVHNSQNVGKPGYDVLRQAFLDAAPFYKVNNNGGDVPVNMNCTRAEILPYIEAIQKALDYYNQVN